MDFKSIGINWYVNICEKLETVCIEVEDKVQETKFVERVQTGCLHVNKCFAELRQELFPSSCTAPSQEKVSDSSALEEADTNDTNGSHKEFGDIPVTGKVSCPSSNLSEDGDIYDTLPPSPSSVNPIKCVESVISLEGNDVHYISEPTTEGIRSAENEKQAPCPSLENTDTNDIKGSHKEFGDVSTVEKDSCSLLKLFQDEDLYGVIHPSSANSTRCLDSIKSLKGNDAANISEPITEDNSSVPITEDNSSANISDNSERQSPCPSEEVSPSRNEVSLSSSPQNTTLDPEASYSGSMKGVGSNLSVKEGNDTLIHNQSCIYQDENTVNVEPAALEALAVLSALNDMSASSFFSKLSNPDHEKASVVPLINEQKTSPVEFTGRESCSHCEVGGDVDGTRCAPDVTCSLSTYCMDPPVMITNSVEVTGHESGLICENAVTSIKCGSDVSSSLSASDMDPPVIPDEDLVFGVHPNSISPTETKGTSLMASDVTGSSDSNAVEPFMEDIDQFDNVQLGGSCIVIDNNHLLINPGSNKRRSLKKRIQSALASRMRSTKQREYEQLAILYSGIDADIINLRRESSLPTKDLQLMKSAHELSEPDDWELV